MPRRRKLSRPAPVDMAVADLAVDGDLDDPRVVVALVFAIAGAAIDLTDFVGEHKTAAAARMPALEPAQVELLREANNVLVDMQSALGRG
jgi:hypothetical protein